MVHGGGSCSGGGGGGFSSGGFSSGGFSNTALFASSVSNTRRSNGRHKADDCTCWLECCIGLMSFIGLAVCCKHQSRMRRIQILWGWLFLIFGLTGLVIGYSTFGSHTLHTTPSDTVPLTSGISPTFCEGVTTQSSAGVDVYRIVGSPIVSRTNYSMYDMERTTTLSSDTYEYWGFYLTAGSVVKITSCVYNTATFYVVKSDEFNAWKRDNYCNDCAEQSGVTGSCIPGFSSGDVHMFTAHETDEYYFIWANHNVMDTQAEMSFKLKRYNYALSSADKVCDKQNSCDLAYSGMNSDESVILYIPFDSNNQLDDVMITSQCKHRNWLFVVIFLLVPLLTGSCLSLLVFIICKDPTKSTTNTEHVRINTGTHSTSGTFTTSSPSFVKKHNTHDAPVTSSRTSTFTRAPEQHNVLPPSYKDVVAKNF